MEDFVNHNVVYSLDELKEIIISKNDAEIIHKIKRLCIRYSVNKIYPEKYLENTPKILNMLMSILDHFWKVMNLKNIKSK